MNEEDLDDLRSAKNVYFINEKCINQLLAVPQDIMTINNKELLIMFLRANEELARGLDLLWPEWRDDAELS